MFIISCALIAVAIVQASTKVTNHTPYPIKVIISGGAFPTTEWELEPAKSETKVSGLFVGGLCPTSFYALIKEDTMTDYPDPYTEDENEKRCVLHDHWTAGWCGYTREFDIFSELKPDGSYGYSFIHQNY